MTLPFDPTGTLVGNTFTNELHTPILDVAVFPTNVPFYATGFSVPVY